jgi:hypothetical protein
VNTLILTQSEMSDWMHDPRKWFLRYYRRRRPAYDHAYIPDIGTFYHAGLEGYYRGAGDPLAIVQAKAEAIIATDPPERAIEDLLKAAEMAGIMLEGYLEWCPEQDAHLRAISSEEQVEVQLPNTPYLLRGKIDARAIDERSEVVVQLEHKTVQGLEELPKYAQSNFQFLTYDLLAYLLHLLEAPGHELRTDGVLLNMARRVKRTPRATPPFYGRHEVRHNLSELRNHWKHVAKVGDEIAAARVALDDGGDPQVICRPVVGRDSVWGNPYFPLYRVMDDGGDWEGMLEDLYVDFDPLERYEQEGEA